MKTNRFWRLKTWDSSGEVIFLGVVALAFYIPFKIWSKISVMVATLVRSVVASFLLMSFHTILTQISSKSYVIYFHEPLKNIQLVYHWLSFSSLMARLPSVTVSKRHTRDICLNICFLEFCLLSTKTGSKFCAVLLLQQIQIDSIARWNICFYSFNAKKKLGVLHGYSLFFANLADGIVLKEN